MTRERGSLAVFSVFIDRAMGCASASIPLAPFDSHRGRERGKDC